ncbi:cysteine proteinase [Saitoella complicata NRRL Y-17804]|uniref:cysteine proteinase n=1 Tax=Saitoella complicata (strain BCRC 22490 / CBS 7301 / JCM 7358 / NBRC 10748 / NRRL Y-17804) TaxID=698492 RepID=UPI000866FE6F|nr:cysteine proteinase [Saitoella complicata NRRL Y-17804]ODQ54037.1 cysteine proteinase [Saitoella complicata NRRL Y-17804]
MSEQRPSTGVGSPTGEATDDAVILVDTPTSAPQRLATSHPVGNRSLLPPSRHHAPVAGAVSFGVPKGHPDPHTYPRGQTQHIPAWKIGGINPYGHATANFNKPRTGAGSFSEGHGNHTPRTYISGPNKRRRIDNDTSPTSIGLPDSVSSIRSTANGVSGKYSNEPIDVDEGPHNSAQAKSKRSRIALNVQSGTGMSTYFNPRAQDAHSQDPRKSTLSPRRDSLVLSSSPAVILPVMWVRIGDGQDVREDGYGLRFTEKVIALKKLESNYPQTLNEDEHRIESKKINKIIYSTDAAAMFLQIHLVVARSSWGSAHVTYRILPEGSAGLNMIKAMQMVDEQVTWEHIQDQSKAKRILDGWLDLSNGRPMLATPARAPRATDAYTEGGGAASCKRATRIKKAAEESDGEFVPASETRPMAETRARTRAQKPTSSNTPILTYPPGGSGITLYNDDLDRLDDGEFLNDSIIDFYLKYLQQRILSSTPDRAKEIHMFNTFFYKRLRDKDKNGNKPGYDNVKKWTAKVDLFRTKYVVVPVNENLHWYVALICNLDWLPRKLADGEAMSEDPLSSTAIQPPTASDDDSDDTIMEVKATQEQDDELVRGTPITPGLREKDGSGAIIDIDSTPFDSIESTPNPNQSLDKKAEKAQKKRDNKKPIEPGKPVIIIFDSLGGHHNFTGKTLRTYIQLEALAKRNLAVSIEDVAAVHARVPRQSNFCDCGVFLLHYVEKFLENPERFLPDILSRRDKSGDVSAGTEDLWKSGEIGKKRAELREMIEGLSAEWQVEMKKAEEEKKRAKEAEIDKAMSRASLNDARDEKEEESTGKEKESVSKDSGVTGNVFAILRRTAEEKADMVAGKKSASVPPTPTPTDTKGQRANRRKSMRHEGRTADNAISLDSDDD